MCLYLQELEIPESTLIMQNSWDRNPENALNEMPEEFREWSKRKSSESAVGPVIERE
jgi:hypothetical protein